METQTPTIICDLCGSAYSHDVRWNRWLLRWECAPCRGEPTPTPGAPLAAPTVTATPELDWTRCRTRKADGAVCSREDDHEGWHRSQSGARWPYGCLAHYGYTNGGDGPYYCAQCDDPQTPAAPEAAQPIATVCPECGTPGQVLPDPYGLIRPELQCAACPACTRVYRVQANLAPDPEPPAATCVYCGQPVAVGFSALCEQHLAMCIPCVESHARDEAPHVGCVQVDCYCFDCHAPTPELPAYNPEDGAPCAQCGHGRALHYNGRAECWETSDTTPPTVCPCPQFQAREAAQETHLRCVSCGFAFIVLGPRPSGLCPKCGMCAGPEAAQRADEAELPDDDDEDTSERLPLFCNCCREDCLVCGDMTEEPREPPAARDDAAPADAAPLEATCSPSTFTPAPDATASARPAIATGPSGTGAVPSAPATPRRPAAATEGTPEGDAARWLANRGLRPIAGGSEPCAAPFPIIPTCHQCHRPADDLDALPMLATHYTDGPIAYTCFPCWLPKLEAQTFANCQDCGGRANIAIRQYYPDVDFGPIRCWDCEWAEIARQEAAEALAAKGLPPMAGGAPSHYTDPAWLADEAWALQEERNAESAVIDEGCIDCEDGGRESPEGPRRRCSNCPDTVTWPPEDRAAGLHTHFCPTCHRQQPCTGIGCADEPRECSTCSQCRGW